MKLADLPAPAYWASGGGVMSRQGPLSAVRALELLRFFGREASARLVHGDRAGARFCARTAKQLALALSETDSWRRAATAPMLSHQVNSQRYG